VIALFDVVGSAGKGSPKQMAAIAVNTGITLGLTVIVSVVVVAH